MRGLMELSFLDESHCFGCNPGSAFGLESGPEEGPSGDRVLGRAGYDGLVMPKTRPFTPF